MSAEKIYSEIYLRQGILILKPTNNARYRPRTPAPQQKLAAASPCQKARVPCRQRTHIHLGCIAGSLDKDEYNTCIEMFNEFSKGEINRENIVVNKLQ